MLHDDAVSQLEAFARRPIAFHCRPQPSHVDFKRYPAAGKHYPSSDARITAPIRHELFPPAGADALDFIRQQLGRFSDDFVTLYRRHDGCDLYIDERSRQCGIKLLQVRDWAGATEGMRSWLAEVPEEYDPARLKTGMAFGHVPNGSDFLAVPVEGDYAGQIMLCKHSDSSLPPFASTLSQALVRLMQNPIALLTQTLGDYFRCSDGNRAIWIPETVEGDTA